MSYYARIRKDNEGYYIVTFPTMPSLHTYGETYSHAKEMAKDVLEGWLLTHKQIGNPIPKQKKHACKDCVEIQVSPGVMKRLMVGT